jgi:hypothetical protein
LAPVAAAIVFVDESVLALGRLAVEGTQSGEVGAHNWKSWPAPAPDLVLIQGEQVSRHSAFLTGSFEALMGMVLQRRPSLV